MVTFAFTPAHLEHPNSLVLQHKYHSTFDIRRELGDDDAIELSEMLNGDHGECNIEELVLTLGP
jgi:hypothetical protein